MAPAVVLDEVGVILRLGLQSTLAAAGVAVVADPARADVALIDLDAVGARDRADALMDAFPGLTVIGCSAQRPVMRVLSETLDGGERPLTNVALQALVRRAAATR